VLLFRLEIPRPAAAARASELREETALHLIVLAAAVAVAEVTRAVYIPDGQGAQHRDLDQRMISLLKQLR